MITLIENKTFNKHKTIWTKDLNYFCSLLTNSKIFKTYENPNSDLHKTRWRIIKDKNEIKDILSKNYSSMNRGEDYKKGLPSTTVITDTLFPINLKTELFKLSWLNNIEEKEHSLKEQYNKESQEYGIYIHTVLEKYLKNKSEYYKKNIQDIIKEIRYSQEIKKNLPNFIKQSIILESIARETLINFIKNELYQYDYMASEYFFNTGRIQGTIDFIGIKDNICNINDFKTTRKTYKNGSRKFSSFKDIDNYNRQLCSYYNGLYKSGVFSKNEKINFNIFQFHLLSNEYKVFKIKKEDIIKWSDEIEMVLDWYWDSKLI